MSRCFPFPPPGYEKKITTTASDLLKKEKHKEKKHKKEKRDKEKREDKEKKDKDKDRSDGKNREKKDKKDKHRDKKIEKARDKDRQTDNPCTSGETRHKVLPEGCDGQIVNQKTKDTWIVRDDCRTSRMAVGYNEENHSLYTSLARETNGVKFVQDFDRRITGDVKTAGGPTGESITHHKRNEAGGMLYLNNHLTNNIKDSDLALELDRRLKDEAEQPYDQSQINNKIIATHQRKDVGVIKSVSLNTMERGDNRVKGTSGGYIPVKSTGTTMVTNVSGPALSNHDRTQIPLLGGTSGKKIEGQARVNHQEDELQQRGMKRKNKDRNEEKKSHGRDKSREKEKKEDKGNSRGDQNRAEQGTRESHKMDILRTPDHEMLSTGEYNNSNTPKMRSLNRVKEPLTNGFHHVTGPNKLSTPSSIHLHNENGRAPEPRQNLVKPSPDGQRVTNIIKVDKAGQVNGVIESIVQRPVAEQVVQAQPRSPHPDAKRLNEILSVPKIEELSGLDDSDWLFGGGKEKPEKKHKVEGSLAGTIADTPQVWSKATNIDSADVYALPYVIPY